MVEQIKDAVAEVASSVGQGMAKRDPFLTAFVFAFFVITGLLSWITYSMMQELLQIKLTDQQLEMQRQTNLKDYRSTLLEMGKASDEKYISLTAKVKDIEDRDEAREAQGASQVDRILSRLDDLKDNQNLRSIMRPQLAPPQADP